MLRRRSIPMHYDRATSMKPRGWNLKLSICDRLGSHSMPFPTASIYSALMKQQSRSRAALSVRAYVDIGSDRNECDGRGPQLLFRTCSRYPDSAIFIRFPSLSCVPLSPPLPALASRTFSDQRLQRLFAFPPVPISVFVGRIRTWQRNPNKSYRLPKYMP